MTETKLEIYYKRDKALEREMMVLDTWKTSPRNKELIRSFRNYLLSTSSKQLRVAKLSSQLRRICTKLRKDLDAVTRQDIQDLVAYYNQLPSYSDATKSDYKRSIKQFYKWFEDDDDDERLDSEDKQVRQEATKFYKFVSKEIKTAYGQRKADPKTIISDEDIDYVLEHGCKSIKEKAFIKLLHETGVRIGEMLNIKIADLNLTDNYATIRVDGKTGERLIPIVTALPLIIRHLEMHSYGFIERRVNTNWQTMRQHCKQLSLFAAASKHKILKDILIQSIYA